jgi:DNA polymerase III delta subunit
VLSDIEAGRVGRALLLIGENSLLVDEIIARLRAAIVDPAFAAFDEESWLADEVSPEAFEQAVRQVPTGSPRRLVVVKGITRHGSKGPAYSQRLGAHGTGRLLALLAAAPESACGVLTGIAKPELTRLIAKHGLASAVVPVDQPAAEELVGFARHRARAAGLDLTPEAARLLVETTGEDAAIVKCEVEKLAVAFPPGAKVSPGDVRRLAGASREFTLAEYVGRVLRRDVTGALAVLRRLEAWGNPRDLAVGIIAWLTNAFVDLAAATTGAPPSWRVREVTRHWRSLPELNRLLQALYRINRDLVTGRPGTFARLELLTACIGCRADAVSCDAFAAGAPAEGPGLCLMPRRKRSVNG